LEDAIRDGYLSGEGAWIATPGASS
jgi:hypothetical protein